MNRVKKVFVIGSINTDFNIRAPHMPDKGETLVGSGFFTAHGGKGANQAVAAARLGGNVVMCGCVGDDTFGREAVAALSADGIDVSNVRIAAGVPTGNAVIILSEGDNRIIIDKGANAEINEADIDRTLENAQKGDVLLVQLEAPVHAVGYAMKKGGEKGMTVILNPAPANKEITEYLSLCDIVIPNETETELLGGEEAIVSAIRGTLIITLGGDGYAIIKNGEKKKYPCIKIDPVDTTAAGDTFCGGLAAKLAMGEKLEDAAAFSSLAASIACTRVGAQPSVPTEEEVNDYKKDRNDRRR